MAKRPRIIRPEPPGDFNSRFVTLNQCKQFSGGNYELIGGRRTGDKWQDLVKSTTGQSDWFDHAAVMQAVQGYWEPIITTQPTT